MNTINQKLLTIFAIFFMAFFTITCKKEEKKSVEITPALSYVLSVNELLPMQMVTVQANGNISQEKLTGLINSQPVELYKSNDKEWSFICPVLVPGTYALTVNGLFTLNFTVKTYFPIQNPETTISFLKTEVSQLQTNLGSSTLTNKQDLADNLSYLKNGLDEITTKLTNEEKIQLAYFINTNGLANANFSESLTTNLPDSFLGKGLFFDPNDAADLFILKFTEARINGLISVATAVALFLAPEPTFISKGLGVLCSISAIANIAVLHKLIDEDLSKLLSKAVDMDAFQKKATEFNFTNGQKLNIGFKATFNNFIETDKTAGRFPILFNGITEVNNKLENFYTAYLKVKSWFTGTQPITTKKLLVVSNAVKQKTFYLNPKYLTIISVSNPNIKVEISTVGTDVFLKATSTTIKVKTNFTVTIKYNQANVNNSIEKTYNATLEPGFDLIGTWNCIEGKLGSKNYFDYTDEWETTCYKTSPPTVIKLIDVIKRDFVKWIIKNETEFNWQEKGIDIRQKGIDADCIVQTPTTSIINQSLAATYILDGTVFKIKIENEESIWTFEKIANDQFKVQNSTYNFSFIFKKQ
ncbi:MAG: hypothetical protein ACOVSR_03655 [Bacteroidia bacterium]